MIKILGQNGFLCAAIFLTTALTASPVRADEVWEGDYGRVIYQSERGKTAVFTYGDGVQAALFINGLAGQFKN